MKKILSERWWGNRTRRLQARQQREWFKARRAERKQPGRYADFWIDAPVHFSLVDNPEDVLQFVSDVMHHASKKERVRLDLRATKVLSPDAAALLFAKIRQRLHKTTRIRVSRPTLPEPRRIWDDSGIGQLLRLPDAENLPEPHGTIVMKSELRVDADAALFLREFAERFIELEDDRQWLSIQTILLELMANTVNHSEGAGSNQSRRSKEPWYAAVYCDETTGRAKFTLLDTGIGILESLKRKPLWKEALMMSTTPAPTVLFNVLDGKITSSTGLKHRGEGLPEIRSIAVFDREIDRLIIVTNRVHADVVNNKYRSLPHHFHGTVVYWEKIGRWKKKT